MYSDIELWILRKLYKANIIFMYLLTCDFGCTFSILSITLPRACHQAKYQHTLVRCSVLLGACLKPTMVVRYLYCILKSGLVPLKACPTVNVPHYRRHVLPLVPHLWCMTLLKTCHATCIASDITSRGMPQLRYLAPLEV